MPRCSACLGPDQELRTSRVVRRGRLHEWLAGAGPNGAGKRKRKEERLGEKREKKEEKEKNKSIRVCSGFKNRIYTFLEFSNQSFVFYAN